MKSRYAIGDLLRQPAEPTAQDWPASSEGLLNHDRRILPPAAWHDDVIAFAHQIGGQRILVGPGVFDERMLLDCGGEVGNKRLGLANNIAVDAQRHPAREFGRT